MSRSDMKLISSTVSRPVTCFIILAVVILMQIALVFTMWYVLAHQVKHDMEVANLTSKDVYMGLLSNIKDCARSILLPINISTLGLSRVLNSSINGSLSSFSTIEDQVARYLFLAFSIIPHLSQSSYIGENGLLFSYCKEGINQTFALFANSSNTADGGKIYRRYRQSVNSDTGMRFGEAIETAAPTTFSHPTWYDNATSHINGNVSWSWAMGETEEPLFIYAAPVKEFLPQGQRGIICLGVPAKIFTNFMSKINIYGGYIFSATEDGHFLMQTGPPNTNISFNKNTLAVQLKRLEDNMTATSTIYLPCKLNSSGDNDNLLLSSNVDIWSTRYEFYCTSFEIAGLRLVAALIIPHRGFESLHHKQCIIALTLLVLMLTLILPASCYYIYLHIRATKREILLSATLIKQMETTRQAERKSMNKSIAFASASHDVRTSLAAITGLIDLSLNSVSPQVELRTNLEQMSSCASNLLGILNSVLDTSKIEAGKMQLEEKEFDLAQVVEEAVEIFYAVGLKKGLDVMLDPCDGSILKCPHVVGDCGRLKQIIHNLLSNAVKFTSEGHIILRAWLKKPSFENSYLASDHSGCFPNLQSCFSNLKNGDASNDLGSIHSTRQDPGYIEFVVEVDDTGKGIPKEKQKSVFENYVQVKESGSEGQQGTGLGLGIVQSLVRLMGGEIMIIDKEFGEKGTCFRFNAFLHACETNDSNVVQEATNKTVPQVARKDLKMDCLHAVVLLGRGKEESLILQRWMEFHGMKVWPINQCDQLHLILEKIKHKIMFTSHSSTSGKLDSIPLQSYFGDSLSHYSNELNRRTNQNGEPNCVLIIIDMSYEYFSEICSTLARFKKNTDDLLYKVAWLIDPKISQADLKRLESSPCDLILQKPFHRSHLSPIIQLFQENIGDSLEGQSNEIRIENVMSGARGFIKLGPSNELMNQTTSVSTSTTSQSSYLTQKRARLERNLSTDKTPLSGMNVLVAEDNAVLRRLAITTLSRLGAIVECCENGEEALDLIRKALQGIDLMHNVSRFNQEATRLSKRFSYDIVLMDCEMPKMNGYEATKRIRIEERQYGIHIPIIALTAHAMAEEANRSIQAGMDFHLVKPLTANRLLEAIQSIKT